jgi:hypothetical protein
VRKNGKIEISSLEIMEEEDRKLLEMFNMNKKSILSLLDHHDSIKRLRPEKKIKDTFKKSRIENFSFKINHKKKKPIFKIEKINKIDNETLINLLIYLLGLLEQENIKNEISILLDNNHKILSSLYDSHTLEENRNNLMTWIHNHSNFFNSELSCPDLNYKNFISDMNELLSKWNYEVYL